MKNLKAVRFPTTVYINPDKSAFFDSSKKKSTPHRPAMSICVLVSCRIYFSEIYRTVSASAYIPQKIIYVRILSSKFKVCTQQYLYNIRYTPIILVRFTASSICAARLVLSRFIFTLKKLCRTMTYILSNISNPNITFAEYGTKKILSVQPCRSEKIFLYSIRFFHHNI